MNKEERLKKFNFEKILFLRDMRSSLDLDYGKELKRNKSFRKTQIQINASFLYIHALFETFLSKYIKFIIHQSKEIRERYIMVFETEINKKFNEGDQTWNNNFKNIPRKMISNSELLEKEKKAINLIKILLDHPKDDYYKVLFDSYTESRVRRNLISHRGIKPDSIYYDELKKWKISTNSLLKILKKKSIYAHSINMSEETNKVERKENHYDSLIDLSITPRMLTLSTLEILELVSYFFSRTNIKGVFDFSDFHDILKLGLKNKDMEILYSLTSMHSFNLRSVSKKIGKVEMDISETVNSIILLSAMIENKFSDEKTLKKMEKTIQTLLKTIKTKDYKERDEIYFLMEAYTKNNKKMFLKHTKKFLKNKKNKNEYLEWAMFDKYRNHKEFKALV